MLISAVIAAALLICGSALLYFALQRYRCNPQKPMEIQSAAPSSGLGALIEQSPDTIARYDREGRLIYSNAAFRKLSVTAPGSESNADGYCGEHYREKIKEVLFSGMEETIECCWIGQAGESINSSVRLVPERDAEGRICGVNSIGRDITELKEIEHHLRESRALLRELTARRELSTEQMRKDIAKEIHEEHGQSLGAIRIKLALLQMRFGQTEPELRQSVGALTGLLDHTIAKMREMVSAIHPSVLNMGIAAALEWLADDTLGATDMRYEVRLAEDMDEIDKTATGLVFKIVQLALDNVVNHAAARNVTVTFAKRIDSFQLEVRDDGKGFDLDQSRRSALGLVEMEELSNRLNGEIVFLSEPGKGTVIEVVFPAKQGLAVTA